LEGIQQIGSQADSNLILGCLKKATTAKEGWISQEHMEGKIR